MDRIILRCFTITQCLRHLVNGFLPSLCVCLLYINNLYSNLLRNHCIISFKSSIQFGCHEAWTFLIVCNMKNIFSENNLNCNLTMIIYGWSKKVLLHSDNTSKMAITKHNSVKLSEMFPFPQNQLNFLNHTSLEMICDQIYFTPIWYVKVDKHNAWYW